MKLKSLLTSACLLAACLSGNAFAQETVEPIDGQMVRLDAKKMWRFAYLPNIKLSNPVKIAEDMAYPAISPDGSRIVMFKKDEALGNSLQEWKKDSKQFRELARGDEISHFITWKDEATIAMRERSKPFFRNGAHLRYDIAPKKATLRDRKPFAEANFVAYDQDDVIILESKKTKTLQAISETGADRYYAPVVSPDERFVAFCGLTGGVYLFDIAANAVVFIGSHGTYPTFSPDGRYLTYTDARDDGHDITQSDLVLIDLDKRSYRIISNPDGELRMNATLSRNAEEIAYMRYDGTIIKAELPFKNTEE